MSPAQDMGGPAPTLQLVVTSPAGVVQSSSPADALGLGPGASLSAGLVPVPPLEEPGEHLAQGPDGAWLSVRVLPFGPLVVLACSPADLDPPAEELNARLDAVAGLAAGVAHEVNNPLAWLLANLNFALEELGRGAAATVTDVEAALRDARAGAERVRRIVQDLNVFARVDAPRRGPVDVSSCVARALRLAAPELRRVRVEQRLEQVPLVDADEARLGQVLLELLARAAHVATQHDDPAVEVTLGHAADGQIVVTVRDSGGAASTQAALSRLVPFSAGRGSGRGDLALCHALVQHMGGALVASGDGGGASVSLLLPAHRMAVTPPPRAATVVVLDDEPAINRLFERVLGTVHRVHAFVAPEPALAALSRLTPDIVFCDLRLEDDASGVDVYRRACEREPTLGPRFVFMTGGAFDQRALEVQREGRLLLEKPFAVERLRELVSLAAARA